MTESGVVARWHRLSTRGKVVVGVLAALPFVAFAIWWLVDNASLEPIDPENPAAAYVTTFVLVALDGVMPIFPAETTLNAGATLAAQGKLDLAPIIVMGALGAIVGDSSLFWIARKFSRRIERQLTRAKADPRVQSAFDLLNTSPAVLIIGGRYVPGMRFVVNASMGLSDIRYRRFALWSVVSGCLWSTYTCVLAYEIGQALGAYPLASFIISGLVTGVVLAIIALTVRRHRKQRKSATAG